MYRITKPKTNRIRIYTKATPKTNSTTTTKTKTKIRKTKIKVKILMTLTNKSFRPILTMQKTKQWINLNKTAKIKKNPECIKIPLLMSLRNWSIKCVRLFIIKVVKANIKKDLLFDLAFDFKNPALRRPFKDLI